MFRETVTPLVLAALVVLAGCAGAMSGAPGGSSGDTGTVNFYISDERNAIDDFEHLNVTIDKVGFKLVDGEGDDNESEDNETTTTEDTTTVNTTTATTDNETTTTAGTETTTTTAAGTTTAEPEEDGEANESEEAEDKEEAEGWVVRDVNNVTIDLTEYQGANATLLSDFDVPNGTYTNVFVYVSEVNGTLTTGEQVNVKLPSQKLKINKQFTIGNGESVDFVFDISVFKAGQSGMYILKPVVGQSGTEAPIEAEGRDDESGSENAGPPEDAGPDDASALNASFLGNVTPGETVTVSVTQNGSAVAGAQVFVDDRRVGQTDANGTITVSVPSDAEDFEVKVRYQGGEAELEVEFESEDSETATTSTPA
ncbi:MAG: DUF4382 domain-containing protein [Halobacteriaceae archaeon]